MCLRIDCISPVKFALQRKKKERIFKDLKLHKTLSKENHGLRDTACVLQ